MVLMEDRSEPSKPAGELDVIGTRVYTSRKPWPQNSILCPNRQASSRPSPARAGPRGGGNGAAFTSFVLLVVSPVDTVFFVLSSWLLFTEELALAGPKRGQGHTSKPLPLEQMGATLRRRAGAVISVLLGPRGTRKYVGEKFPLPHGGEDVGGERAEDGEQRWEDVSGPRCAHHPSPGGAG